MQFNTKGLIQNMLQLFSTVNTSEFSKVELLHSTLSVLRQLAKIEREDVELSERLRVPREIADRYHDTIVTIVSEYKSFVWLVRVLSHRPVSYTHLTLPTTPYV
eukprot:TRINITY_DN12907_c0_g1_i1.p1 TRINITY_DN12907_c0_g1~~TRINITY_DN12907_c0_g1_i1.p1  ORF type:complete len:104 (-),score=11.22 TRINITY_DN12907_c0_g1_i1:37-348(-)